MSVFHWIDIEVVYAIHARQLAEHGGSDGIRDVGLIESALARPKNIHSYEKADISDLTAGFLPTFVDTETIGSLVSYAE